MPNNQLAQFNSTITQTQIQQALATLNNARNAGQVQTITEFNQRLTSLIQDLTSTTLQPSLQVFTASGDLQTSAEQYNMMLTDAGNDLQAAFKEAINIDEVQRDHSAIVNDVMFQNLLSAIAQIQSQVTAYEFMSAIASGFGQSISSNFDGATSSRTLRNSTNTILFVDPKFPYQGGAALQDVVVPTQKDADVELADKTLMLAVDPNGQQYWTPTGVTQIFDGNSAQTDLVVTPASTPLSNIIDNTIGTYWVSAFLFSSRQDNIIIQIEIDYGTLKPFNFIEVQPISNKYLTLTQVNYLDQNNVVQNLENPGYTLAGPTGVRIPPINTKKLILVFEDTNCIPIHIDDINASNLSLFEIAQQAQNLTQTSLETA